MRVAICRSRGTGADGRVEDEPCQPRGGLDEGGQTGRQAPLQFHSMYLRALLSPKI